MTEVSAFSTIIMGGRGWCPICRGQPAAPDADGSFDGVSSSISSVPSLTLSPSSVIFNVHIRCTLLDGEVRVGCLTTELLRLCGRVFDACLCV